MKTSIPVLITYISENVTIFNIYVIQMVIKLAISIINSDKFSGSYDDLYIDVTFWDTRYIGEERAYERGGTSHFILHKCVTYFVSDSSCSFLFFFGMLCVFVCVFLLC